MQVDELARAARAFPCFLELTPQGFELLARSASVATFAPGQALAWPGLSCHQIAFVLDGEVRAHKTSEAGRDLTLYRIGPGQTCVLTALTMLGDLTFPVHADVAEPATAVVVPRRTFERLFDTEEPWRTFVFRTMTERIGDLLGLIDDVLFTDLPARLAAAVLTLQQSGIVRLTHEQLAGEVGSSREVVSRVLKTWERRGIVALARGQIAVTSRHELERLAGR